MSKGDNRKAKAGTLPVQPESTTPQATRMANNEKTLPDTLTTALLRCSFCDRDQHHVRKLIAGPHDVFICDECVLLCVDIIEEESEDAGRPAFRHCLVRADQPRYSELLRALEEHQKIVEAAEPIIPHKYTAIRESIAALLRPRADPKQHPPK